MSFEENERLHRVRGWIIKLLYVARPDPVELTTLIIMLDKKNFPLTRRSLANDLDYLRAKQLVRIFPAGAQEEVSNVEQAKWLQRFAATRSDDELGHNVTLCCRLSALGINFQEGLTHVHGVERRS